MRRLLLGAVLLAAGCRGAADPCDAFRLQTCLALRVRGGVGSVDQIEVEALSGFALSQSRTPRTPEEAFFLPVVVPIGIEDFGGEFSLLARALRGGSEVAFGTASDSLRPREHKTIEVSLVPTQPLDGGADLPCSSSLEADPRHCGSCENDCTALPFVDVILARCAAGACDVGNACRAGHAHCSSDPTSGCETEISTAANCGGCNAACPATAPLCARDATASGGYSCIVGCGGATPDRCGESCVDLDGDPEHCGSCDRRCDVPVGGSAVCNARACDFTCGAGSKKTGDQCLEWEPETSGVTQRLNGVWGSSNADVWVAADEGRLLRSSGDGNWNVFYQPAAVNMLAVGGTGASDVVATGGVYNFQWNGSAWTQTILGVPMFSVGARGGVDLFTGGLTLIYRLDGPGMWTSKSTYPSGVAPHIWGMTVFAGLVTAAGLNAAAGSGLIMHSTNRGDSWVIAAQGTFPGLYAVWGLAVDDQFACGYSGTILHKRGNMWLPETSGSSAKLLSGISAAPGAIYVVGEMGTVLFSTGDGRWTPQRSGTTVDLRGVWGVGADVWAAGADGVILRKVK